MANYNMVINSRFRPFSYQEMVAPLQQMTDTHNAQEAAMNELATKAATLESMVNSNPNSKAAATYRQYQDELKSYAEMLAKEGLNPTSTRNLYDARTSYAQNIVPIETALNRRRQLAEEQRQLKIKDPTTLINRDAASFEIDDLISNPEMSYTSHSGENLRQQSALMASQLKNAITNKEDWKGTLYSQIGDVVSPQYFERLTQYGLTPDQILNSHEYTEAIRQKVLASSGISSWENPQVLNNANNYIEQGLYHAIGKPVNDRVANRMFEIDPNKGGNGKSNLPPINNPQLWGTSGVTGKTDPIIEKRLSYSPQKVEGVNQGNFFMGNPKDVEFLQKAYKNKAAIANANLNDEAEKIYQESLKPQYATTIKGELVKTYKIPSLEKIKHRNGGKDYMLISEYINNRNEYADRGIEEDIQKSKDYEIYGNTETVNNEYGDPVEQSNMIANWETGVKLEDLKTKSITIDQSFIAPKSATRSHLKATLKDLAAISNDNGDSSYLVKLNAKGEETAVSGKEAEEIMEDPSFSVQMKEGKTSFKIYKGGNTYTLKDTNITKGLNSTDIAVASFTDYSPETLTDSNKVIVGDTNSINTMKGGVDPKYIYNYMKNNPKDVFSFGNTQAIVVTVKNTDSNPPMYEKIMYDIGGRPIFETNINKALQGAPDVTQFILNRGEDFFQDLVGISEGN